MSYLSSFFNNNENELTLKIHFVCMKQYIIECNYMAHANSNFLFLIFAKNVYFLQSGDEVYQKRRS